MSSSAVQKRILGHASLMGFGILLSRVLGAVRDAVIAAVFRLSATDAFFVAFTVPNTLRQLLAEGAASSAFVPVLTELRTAVGQDRARVFLARMTGVMLLILLGFTVLGIVFAPEVITLYAAGYRRDPAKFALTVELTRWVFPYIFLMGFATLAASALQASGRFVAPSLSPLWLNVATIAAPWTLAGAASAMGLPFVGTLVVGSLLGGVLQAWHLWVAASRQGYGVWPAFAFGDVDVQRALKRLLPLTVGLGVYQANVMLSRLFASFLYEGAQSYLYYSLRVVDIPQAMVGVALGTAALPSLAELKARGDEEALAREVASYAGFVLFIGLPCSLVLAALAEPVTSLLFLRGEFGYREMIETAASVRAQALGIAAVLLVRTLVPVFHALGDTRTPVVCSALNLVVFAGVSLAGLKPFGHVAIAAAISCAAALQALALAAMLARRKRVLELSRVFASAVRPGISSLAAAAAAFGVVQLGHWHEGLTSAINLAVFAASCIVGAAVYIAFAHLLRCPEMALLGQAVQRMRAKFARSA